jgi:hypothetical protein
MSKKAQQLAARYGRKSDFDILQVDTSHRFELKGESLRKNCKLSDLEILVKS